MWKTECIFIHAGSSTLYAFFPIRLVMRIGPSYFLISLRSLPLRNLSCSGKAFTITMSPTSNSSGLVGPLLHSLRCPLQVSTSNFHVLLPLSLKIPCFAASPLFGCCYGVRQERLLAHHQLKRASLDAILFWALKQSWATSRSFTQS